MPRKSNKSVTKRDIGNISRATRVLEQKKERQIKVGEGVPKNFSGADGDIQIRNIDREGVFLYSKYRGTWHRSKMGDTIGSSDNSTDNNSRNSIIYSNTSDGDILVYDSVKRQYVGRTLSGHLSIDKSGKVTINVGTLNENITNSLRLISDNFVDDIIYGDSIKYSNILLKHLRYYDSSVTKSSFSVVADTGANLNVGGAFASAIIDLTGQPDEGVAATGSITKDVTKGLTPQVGSIITIDDSFGEKKFQFYIGSYQGTYLGVEIEENLSDTLTNLKTSIDLHTTINCTLTPSEDALLLTQTIYGAEGNVSISQSNDDFTLAGLSGGSGGEYFEIPLTERNIITRFTYRPNGSSDNTNATINLSDEKEMKFPEKGADVTATALNTKNMIDALDSHSASVSTDTITITSLSAGASSNGSVVDGGSNITVTQDFTGGVDATEKYFYCHHPCFKSGINYSDGDASYIRVYVTFDIGGTHQNFDTSGYGPVDDSVQKIIRLDDLTTSSTAQEVSNSIVSALNNYRYKDEAQFVATNGSGTSTTVTVTTANNGYSPAPAAGTSGLTISSLNTGGEGLSFDGDFRLKSAADLNLESGGDITLKTGGYDVNFDVGGTAYFNWNVLGVTTFVSPADTSYGLEFDVSAINPVIRSRHSANLTLKSTGILKLDSTQSSVAFENDGTTHMTMDMNTGDLANWQSATDFNLQFEAQGDGALKFISGGVATIDTASHIVLDAAEPGATKGIRFKTDDADMASIESHHSNKWFYLWHDASNFSSLQTAADGVTKLSTADSDGSAAHFTADIKGDIILDSATGNIEVKDNGSTYTPSSDYHIATKKYVDDNAGGGGAKHWMDWYNYSANLATQNYFYAEKHNDEFGVSSTINTDLSLSGYSTTTLNNAWRMIRYGRRIPYAGDVTKFMAHLESTGAAADSDVEVALWWADALADDTAHSSTANFTCAHLCTLTFDFSSASKHMTKQTTSFNATTVSEGDWFFITLRKTTSGDGSSFHCHSTILWE